MDQIDLSVKQSEEDEQRNRDDKIKAMREEFMSGSNDDLSKLGFVDSDEEVDFSNFKRKTKNEQVEEEVQSIFSRLTGAF
jgi:hypothetical protein